MLSTRTRLDAPLLVFALSGVCGALVAYDSGRALAKLAFVGCGIALYYVLVSMPSTVSWKRAEVSLPRLAMGVVPALISVYLLLTHDWGAAGKLGWLEPLRDALALGAWPTPWPLHPNVAGGVLAMWLPLQVAALRMPLSVCHGARRERPGATGVLLVCLTCAGLLMSELRGAWLALGAAVIGRLAWRLALRNLRRHALWGLVLTSCVGAAVALVVGWPATTAWWSFVRRPDRILVWRNSWDLAWDYAFTGLGLGNFTMPYSSYALLVHVPHTTHAHNLFLDLWLEQGALGVLAFLWVAAAAVLAVERPGGDQRDGARSGRGTGLRPAARLAFLVLLLHGLIDDSYYGYGGIGAAFLLVPAAWLGRRDAPGSVERTRAGRAGMVTCGAAFAAALVVLCLPTTRAVLRANAGALLQTREELSVYEWPTWPIQDAVRRSDAVDLGAATRHYRAALALDPANAVARRRLGQIDLSLGSYGRAREHLETAFRSAPRQIATRQMLGEALALSGDVNGAASLWREIPLEEDQLAIRNHWYRSTDPAGARLVAEAIALSRRP